MGASTMAGISQPHPASASHAWLSQSFDTERAKSSIQSQSLMRVVLVQSRIIPLRSFLKRCKRLFSRAQPRVAPWSADLKAVLTCGINQACGPADRTFLSVHRFLRYIVGMRAVGK